MTQVLIIEDDETLRVAYEFVIKKSGYTVATARNGHEGLELLGRLSPKVVLLDMLMPIKNGMDFLKEAKVSSRYPDTTVILLSNLSESALNEQAIKLGAREAVLKAAIIPSELIKIVAKYVN